MVCQSMDVNGMSKNYGPKKLGVYHDSYGNYKNPQVTVV